MGNLKIFVSLGLMLAAGHLLDAGNQTKGTEMDSGYITNADEIQRVSQWVAGLGDTGTDKIGVESSRQGWGNLGMSKSVIGEPLSMAGKKYEWGLGTHADGEIVIHSNFPIKTFRAWVGIDHNKVTADIHLAEVVFSVWANGKQLAESRPMNIRSAPEKLEACLGGVSDFVLKNKTRTVINYGHADWAEAEVVAQDGKVFKLGVPGTETAVPLLPVSFQYGGMTADAWFRKWGIVKTQIDSPEFITHKYVTTDRDTGLECTFELQQYKKFPAVIWNLGFKNIGTKNTLVLEQVKTLDYRNISKPKILYRSRGAFHYENEPLDANSSGEAFREDFLLVKNDLEKTAEVVFGGVGGRSSVDWMPYFNLAGSDGGVLFGIGWTGQWQTKVSTNGDIVHFQSGMEFIHTVLHPGESIRQPATLMIRWVGNDPIRGHNLLRRFMTDEIMPHYDGKPLQAPITYGAWGGMPVEEHLKRIKLIKEQRLPYDYYWIDAGWYGPDEAVDPDPFKSKWPIYVGIWKHNKVNYPQGLKPVSDAAHQAGMKFLLWFEPERAVCGTPITEEHPDWFLGKRQKGENLLLNLGNHEAWKWCTELVAGKIKEYGIDCYRQDFNFSPLFYWQENDTPDRVGITEIRHITGLYAFWDELRKRNPNLLIDNCASGGRRLDFEMMRRSIPLWSSDMQCFLKHTTERNQQQVYGLSLWIPQFSFGTHINHQGDTYHFRSTMAGGIVAHLFADQTIPIDQKYPFQWLRDRMAEYHRAKVYFSGDFYPLLSQSESFQDWSAYQFDRPDTGGGLLEFFRKKDSPFSKFEVPMHGLDPAADYELEDVDLKQKNTFRGSDLMTRGITVELPERRSSRLIFYQKKTVR